MPPPGVCTNILKERQKRDEVGTLTNPVKFLDQDYNTLHQYFLTRKRSFIDEMFPPDNISIGEILDPKGMPLNVEWIRPTKLVKNPYLFVDGVSRFDFAQGIVGNCWFLAALGALTFQKDIMKNLFPGEQSFQKNYAGIFHFRFWRFGKWIDVVIDDKLPTINGKLIFAHSYRPKTPQSPGVPNEFWPALLEKAYAKVCGSYKDMNMGNVSEALMDFTGGVHMSVDPSENPQTMWELIYRAAKGNSLMGCGSKASEADIQSVNITLSNGLITSHAYTVTGVTRVVSNGKPVELVKLFNPWGDTEWRGDWSDTSPIWNTVSAEDREQYLHIAINGEFWMSVEDFCKNFCQLDICSLYPNFLDGSPNSDWNYMSHEGFWCAGSTAGGRRECTDTFWKNPQFRVTVALPQETFDKTNATNTLVSLMQKPDKRNRGLVRKLIIGICIFEVPPEMKHSRGKFPASFFKDRSPAFPVTYSGSREVMEFLDMKAGEYIIVPHTFYPNKTASFIMGIFSKAVTHIDEPHFYIDSSKVNTPTGNQGVSLLRQLSDQNAEINAEQLQRHLNETFGGAVLPGTSGGFSLDTCHSIIAMMDLSVTGTLNAEEFNKLMKKVCAFKEIFFHVDKNKDGIMSLSELRHAVDRTGLRVSDALLKLMSLRYGDASGRISLENFICLALRLVCMAKIFRELTDGHEMRLKEEEWFHLTMYS